MKRFGTIVIIIFMAVTSIYSDEWRITANPCPRSHFNMVNDTYNGRIILHGGFDAYMPGGMYYNDTWALDPISETWKLVNASGSPPSPPRISATAVYDHKRNRMLVFGGWNSGAVYNDLWELDLTSGSESWQELSTYGTPPSPRQTPGIIDDANNRMIIFGGGDASSQFSDAWSLDLGSLTWSQLSPSGTPPPERFAHTVVYDVIAQRMIVFAGVAWGMPGYNDVWELDLTQGSESWQQLSTSGTPPEVRSRHWCVLDQDNYSLIMGFGYNYDGYFTFFSDVWSLDLNTLTWQQRFPGSIAGRRGACAVYDSPNIFVFGGDQYDTYFGDTYVMSFDGLDIEEDEENIAFLHPSIRITPNPFKLPCNISALVPNAVNTSVKICDASGRLVRTLIHDRRSTGDLMIEWNGKDDQGRSLSAGVYFVHLTVDDKQVVEKAVLIK